MSEKATAVQKKTATAPAPTSLRSVEPAALFERLNHLHESIARRAFELFQGRGALCGRDLDDWFSAETEFLHPVHLEISEADNSLTVRAEVPGFSSKELAIDVESRRLTITGKQELQKESKKGKTVYSERCAKEILRIVDLPAEVDPPNASATLKDGILILELPKVLRPQTPRDEAKTVS